MDIHRFQGFDLTNFSISKQVPSAPTFSSSQKSLLPKPQKQLL